MQAYYYSQVHVDQSPSPGVTGSKARFYTSRAAVLREMGRLDEAKASALLAVAMLDPLAQAAPTEAAWRIRLAEAYGELRDVCAWLDRPATLQAGREAIRQARLALEREPDGTESRPVLVREFLELGSILVEDGRLDEAALQVQSAQEAFAQLPPGASSGLNWGLLEADILSHQALILSSGGRKEEALEKFKAALARLEGLCQIPAHSLNKRVLFELAGTHGEVGRVLLELGEELQALHHFSEYCRLAESLERYDPQNIYYRRELGYSLDWLAAGLERRGEPEPRLYDLLHRARSIFQQLENEYPRVEAWQEQGARSLTRLAEWCLRHHRADEGRAALQEELNHRWSLLLQFTHNVRYHTRFVRALDWAGQAAAGDPRRKTEWLGKVRSWSIRVEAEASKPKAAVEWSWSGAKLHYRVAELLAAHSRFDEASPELEASLRDCYRFAQAHPEDAEGPVEVTRALRALTRAKVRAGTQSGLREGVREFVTWVKSAAIQDSAVASVLQAARSLLTDLEPDEELPDSRSAAPREELSDVLAAISTAVTPSATNAPAGPAITR